MSLYRLIVSVPAKHCPLFGLTPDASGRKVLAYPAKAFKTAAEGNRYRRSQRVAHDDFIAKCEADEAFRAKVLAIGGKREAESFLACAAPAALLPTVLGLKPATAAEVAKFTGQSLGDAALAQEHGREMHARLVARVEDAAHVVATADPAPEYDVSRLLDLYRDRKNPRRLDKQVSAQKRFLAFLETTGTKRQDRRYVTFAQINAFRMHLEASGATFYVVRDSIHGLSQMFALCIAEGERPDNPCLGVKPMKNVLSKGDMKKRAKAKTGSLEETLALLAAAREPDADGNVWAGERNEAAALALEGLIHLGTRPHEFLQIQPGDVRETKHGVVVNITDMDARDGYRSQFKTGEGDDARCKHLKRAEHERELPCAGDAADFGKRLLAFARANADKVQLFDCLRWDPKREDYVAGFNELFRALRKRAKVSDRVQPYGFRHAHRTATRNAGIPRDHSLYFCGRAGEGVHDDLYGSPAALRVLFKSAAKVKPLFDHENGDADDDGSDAD